MRGLPSRSIWPFLQHAEQLRLELERQLPDLVEQNRSAVRQLETADLRRMRAGERAALAAEELALDEVRRQRGAVDDDERTGAAHAPAVNGAREQLFARARFAGQQHCGVGRRHLVDAEHHVAKRIAVADDRVAIVGAGMATGAGDVGAAERGDAGELAVLGNGWKRHNTLTRARAPQ